ncbi:MAG: putative ABC transporter permease [Clostridia bacterium]
MGVEIVKEENKKLNELKMEPKKVMNRETKADTFAEGLNFYKLFWIFFIGCIVGVIVETLFGLIVEHRITSRAGVLYGPFNPVYGFGAVIITLAVYPLRKKSAWTIFGVCMVVGAIFEIACSYFQEFCYGTVSWEYSDMPFNILGRTSLLFAIFWGGLGLTWIKYGYPLLSNSIEKIPKKIALPITWILIVFMIFNMAISSVAATRHEARRKGIAPKNKVEIFLDKHYSNEVMDKVYYNAKEVR